MLRGRARARTHTHTQQVLVSLATTQMVGDLNEWMMFLLTCDKKLTKSQLSPTHASTWYWFCCELLSGWLQPGDEREWHLLSPVSLHWQWQYEPKVDNQKLLCNSPSHTADNLVECRILACNFLTVHYQFMSCFVPMFNVRQKTDARYALVCLSVRPSHAGIVSKRFNLSSNCLHCLVVPWFYFYGDQTFSRNSNGNTPTGALNARW